MRLRRNIVFGGFGPFGLGLCLALCAIGVLARAGGPPSGRPGRADPTYRASVEKWRQDYETGLKSEEGWLTVAGLFWLHEGENSFGTDPLGDVILPAKAGPAKAGSFSFRGGKTVAHVRPGVRITMRGQPLNSVELHADSRDERLQMGDLTLYLHASGVRYAIRVKDKNSKLRTDFSGLHWFPVDESYRVVAHYTPYNPPKQVQIQNILGDFDKVAIVGSVAFSLEGKEYRLDAEQEEPGTLSFVFRDLTSGKQTYAAARFLDTDAPKDGTVVLDFNKAYNPPCAYNPYTTCPLPTPGNRLRVAIPAGEKIYKAHSD
jgi:uncharacterized protein (DUF1684 family)